MWAEFKKTAVESGKGKYSPQILDQVKPAMTTQRWSCVWAGPMCSFLGALAVFLFTAAGMRLEAQSGAPATDTFANNASPATVYQDAYSSSCDEKNGTSLAMDSPDPAVCFDHA